MYTRLYKIRYKYIFLFYLSISTSHYYIGSCGRVVKVMDLKSIGVSLHRFKSSQLCVLSFCIHFWAVHIHTMWRHTFITRPQLQHDNKDEPTILHSYRIVGFCHEDFNVASHGICNIKIRYIFIS